MRGRIAASPLRLLLALAVGTAAAATTAPLQAQDREVIGSQPGQPFSAAVRAGNTVYFSGRIALDPEIRAMEEGPERARAETRAILEGFSDLFEQAGVGFDDVVRATVYLTDLDHYDALNEVYLEYFPDEAPARAAVGVDELVGGALVEISFVAVRP